MLLEHDSGTELDTGVLVEDTLLQPSEEGFAQLFIVNPSGFMQVAEEGCVIGKAEAVSVDLGEDQVEQLESVYALLDSITVFHESLIRFWIFVFCVIGNNEMFKEVTCVSLH